MLEIFDPISEDATTSTFLARWREEQWVLLRRGRNAEATARLGAILAIARTLVHPNVARTYSAEGALEESVLLEEHFEGERLDAWLRASAQLPIPWRVVAAVVRDAARGAAAIAAQAPHAIRVVWPERVVIGVDGVARICDPFAELRGLQLPRAVHARYVAPEDRRDAPALVWSLTRILEDLCGTLAEPAAPLRQVLRASIAEQFTTASELADALDALVDEPNPTLVHCSTRRRFARSARASRSRTTLESLRAPTIPPNMAARRAAGELVSVIAATEVLADPASGPAPISLPEDSDVTSSHERVVDRSRAWDDPLLHYRVDDEHGALSLRERQRLLAALTPSAPEGERITLPAAPVPAQSAQPPTHDAPPSETAIASSPPASAPISIAPASIAPASIADEPPAGRAVLVMVLAVLVAAAVLGLGWWSQTL